MLTLAHLKSGLDSLETTNSEEYSSILQVLAEREYELSKLTKYSYCECGCDEQLRIADQEELIMLRAILSV